MKKILLLAVLYMGIMNNSFSTHIAGGDFTVEWVSGNNFRVTLKLFRDCASGGAAFDSPITIAVYDNVTNVLQTTFSMSSPTITLMDLGDECYSPPSSVCIEEGVYQAIVTLPNNPNGYYLAWERCCRNPSIQNINLPGDAGMVFYVQVPDPALHNSTPIFGPYPSTGYLCNGLENIIDFNVTEADGDSLVFSLITPLRGSGTSTAAPTLAGPALPKPYVTVNWQPPYSLADIVGGTPPMSINASTGVITCFPSGSGVFVFAVMVEEYRGGVKISESIRDIQYYVLNCVVDDLPQIMLPDTVYVPVNSTGCFDIVVIDEDVTDTISILVNSPVTFADGATLTMPPPYSTSPVTTYQFFYNDPVTGLPDSVVLPAPTLVGGAYYGIGGIGLRYCWTTSCEDILANPYTLDVSAFSLGCSGDTNFLEQNTEIIVGDQPPPNQNIYLPDSIVLTGRDTTCFDVVVLSPDPTDQVSIVVSSLSFPAGATLTQPTPVSTGPNLYEYFYWNPSTNTLDSVLLEAPTRVGSSYIGEGGVGLRYCWQTDCEDISDMAYHVRVGAYRLGCFGDTIFRYNQAIINVNPPDGVAGVVPNVFTPNGDKINDIFKLGGITNYCYDTIHIQIFNRWGQLVFESNDPEFTWDGKNKKGEAVSSGTYYVLLNGVFGDADVTRHYPVQLFRD